MNPFVVGLVSFCHKSLLRSNICDLIMYSSHIVANQYRIRIESSPSPAPISTYGGLEAVMIGHDYINETFMVTQ